MPTCEVCGSEVEREKDLVVCRRDEITNPNTYLMNKRKESRSFTILACMPCWYAIKGIR